MYVSNPDLVFFILSTLFIFPVWAMLGIFQKHRENIKKFLHIFDLLGFLKLYGYDNYINHTIFIYKVFLVLLPVASITFLIRFLIN